MRKHNCYCILLAGGQGARFWPLSRTQQPKQFLDILGNGYTMIQDTALRFEAVVPSPNFLVMTGQEYQATALLQLPALHPEQILTEPFRRGTAPAIAYAAYRTFAHDPSALMVVTPSDHVVTDTKAFNEVLLHAIAVAQEQHALVTIGIRPTYPATQYGYIKKGERIAEGAWQVARFKEKPCLIEAQKLIAHTGHYLWNSGMFVWHVQDIITALEDHLPQVALPFAALHSIYGTEQESTAVAQAFHACPNISIDYGVMEKAHNVITLEGNFGWTDLGTWHSLHRYLQETNAPIPPHIHTEECPHTLIHTTTKGKKVVAVGLSDYLVVDTDDLLLILPKHDEKKLHQYLQHYAHLTDNQ